jgi:hypothetical protein
MGGLRMDELNLAPTKSTPKIFLDPAQGLLEIEGESFPENAFSFYNPILSAVEAALSDTETNFRLELNLSYLNTSSTRCILALLDLMQKAHEAGKAVSAIWVYDSDNERSLEIAEEFMEEVSFPFETRVVEG